MATLRCELTKEAPVEWRKGTETLRNGDKYSLKQDGAVCELQICNLVVADAGEYMCVCGQERTSATLAVKGKDHTWGHVGQWFTQELTWRSNSPSAFSLCLCTFCSSHRESHPTL